MLTSMRLTPSSLPSAKYVLSLGPAIPHPGWEEGLFNSLMHSLWQVRGYNYIEIIEISKDTLPNYEAKIKTFYEVITEWPGQPLGCKIMLCTIC